VRACVRISSRTFVDGHRVALRFTDAMQIDLNCLGLKGRVPTTVNDLGRRETALAPEAAQVSCLSGWRNPNRRFRRDRALE
jgi:hypothetical protein